MMMMMMMMLAEWTDSLWVCNDAGPAATHEVVEVPWFDAAIGTAAEHLTAPHL